MSEAPRKEPEALGADAEQLSWSAAAGAWEVDYRAGRYFLAASIQRLIGDPPEHAATMAALQNMERVHPDDRPVLQAALASAAASGSDVVEDCEFRLRHRNGSWVWLHTQSRILERFADGSPARIGGWHTDITERKRMEAGVAAASRNVERLSGTEFFQKLASSLTEALNVRYCMIGRLNGQESVTTFGFADTGRVRENFTYRLEGSPCAEALKGEMCIIAHSVTERFPLDAGLRRLGVESYMGMALLDSNGVPCGLISLLDERRMTQPGIARPLLPLFGARASVELERMAAEATRVASQQQYRLLFEHLISACALLEPVRGEDGRIRDFRYVDVNPAFLTMTRWDPAVIIGATVRSMMPNITDDWIDGIAAVAETGQPAHFEQFSTDLNRWCELRAFQPEAGRAAILFHDITERRDIEIALRESERTLREMFENTQLAALLFDLNGRVTFCNEALAGLVGLPAESLVGESWFDRFIPAEERAELFEHLASAGGDWKNFPRHWRNHAQHVNGAKRLIEWDHSPVYDSSGRLSAIAGLGRDLSAWEELEEQYRQAQKMEAVGRLAGGIAHDFNNLLTVINGYSALALARLAEGNEARHSIEEIQKAGDRAAQLTRQLLAFSRKQLFRLRVMNVNDVVSDAMSMLGRLIGAHIVIDCDLEPAPWMVRADPGQMMQVLLNLAVNARDAIDGSGRIILRTKNLVIPDEGDAAFPELSPGPYVELMVADDGSGMSEETQRHLFEPFFTTKPPGEGTGLGLATVYGIVRQLGGAISVRSRMSEGSVFRILLPGTTENQEAEQNTTMPTASEKTEATILLVEDQDAVRELLQTVLESGGYRVAIARDGTSALQLLREGLQPDVLVSDIVMPGMGGPALAAQAREMRPGVRVVLVSGYAATAGKPDCDAYLQKPFTGRDLLAVLRPLLQKGH